MSENELSKIVFDCALKVHQTLGPGLLESAYEECLFFELKKTGLKTKTITLNLRRNKTRNWLSIRYYS